jgi:hypothetical protein
MRLWLLLGSLLCAQAFGQQAYRWTDENGQVHYSDRPAPGATEVQLRGAQGYTAAAAARPAATPTASDEPEVPPAQAYRVFNLIRPSQQETLWNIGSILDVQVDLQPGLQPGHHFGAYLDGELIDVRAVTPEFQLPNVFRGVHTLQAVVLTAVNDEVLRTASITINVQQTSLLNPNNPNGRAR